MKVQGVAVDLDGTGQETREIPHIPKKKKEDNMLLLLHLTSQCTQDCYWQVRLHIWSKTFY